MVSRRRHAGLRRQLCIPMVMMNIQWNNNIICINCYVLCMKNLNLIELFHMPHRVPQTTFSTIKHIYFCMVVACGDAAVHKKSVYYCIILRAPKTQSKTGGLVFEKVP